MYCFIFQKYEKGNMYSLVANFILLLKFYNKGILMCTKIEIFSKSSQPFGVFYKQIELF